MILVQLLEGAPEKDLGVSFDYLMQSGYCLGGWHMARAALCALERQRQGADNPFYEEKILTAGYYIERILPRCSSHGAVVMQESGTLQAYPIDRL